MTFAYQYWFFLVRSSCKLILIETTFSFHLIETTDGSWRPQHTNPRSNDLTLLRFLAPLRTTSFSKWRHLLWSLASSSKQTYKNARKLVLESYFIFLWEQNHTGFTWNINLEPISLIKKEWTLIVKINMTSVIWENYRLLWQLCLWSSRPVMMMIDIFLFPRVSDFHITPWKAETHFVEYKIDILSFVAVRD